MSFEGDPELRELFQQEMTDRVFELGRGARAMVSGDLTDDLAGAMFREGHTIKGTARVMGFEAISRAGQALEEAWQDVQHGSRPPSAELGSALEAVAVAIPLSLSEDEGGTALESALADLSAALGQAEEEEEEEEIEEPAPEPAAEQPEDTPEKVAPEGDPEEAVPEEAPEEPEPEEASEEVAPEDAPAEVAPEEAPEEAPGLIDVPVAVPEAAAGDGTIELEEDPVEEPIVWERGSDDHVDPEGDPEEIVELGGLLSALDTWASEETARVNAAQMFRLINTVASLGIHAESLNDVVLELSDEAEAEERSGEQVERLAAAVAALELSINSARETALMLASAQLSEITNSFPQLVGFLAKKTDKELRFELVGDDVSVDRQILDRLADPIRQLLVNSVQHGIEASDERVAAGKASTATLAIRALIKDHRLEITVEDDGRGVDWDVVHRVALRKGLLPPDAPAEEGALRALLFAPGFSTNVEPSELVGDGTGLTTVAEAVEQLHGSLDFDTSLGVGTRVTIAVPTSRALQDAIIVRAAGHKWGIPEPAVADTFHLDQDDIGYDGGRAEVSWLDQQIPASTFATAVGLTEAEDVDEALVIRSPVGPVALTVPEVIGQRQVAAKELAPILGGTPHLTGAALLASGDVVVLVDPSRLAERAREFPVGGATRPRVLVVDDSQGARQVVAGALASNGFDASVAASTEEALQIISLTPIDALVVDFAMPGPDGIALIEDVRARFGPLPIVMLSGVATPEDQDRARNSGVDAYFDKADFREGALAATLRDLVDGRRQEART